MFFYLLSKFLLPSEHPNSTYFNQNYNKNNINCATDHQNHRQHHQLSNSFEDEYVRDLLALRPTSFRFSTRVLCTYTVCFTVLYYMTCFLVFYGSIVIDMIHMPSAYKRSLVASALLAASVCVAQLLLSMRQLKLHLTSLYKGTSLQYISAKANFSNKKIATSNFNYSGTCVTYTCWGYVIIFGVLTVVLFQATTFLFLGGGGAFG